MVTDFAIQADLKGLRTMDIITKPDTLDVGSDMEKSFIELAKNENVAFRLGGHALRNRDFKTRDHTAD